MASVLLRSLGWCVASERDELSETLVEDNDADVSIGALLALRKCQSMYAKWWDGVIDKAIICGKPIVLIKASRRAGNDANDHSGRSTRWMVDFRGIKLA